MDDGSKPAPKQDTPNPDGAGRQTLTARQLAAIAEELFGEPVVKISAPGGKTRASLRIYFADRTVISSFRTHPKRRAREILLLSKLSTATHLVPEFLGLRENVIFQEDLGGLRLTTELNRLTGQAQEDLALRAFDSLWTIKRAAFDCGVVKDVVPVAMSYNWMMRYVSGPDRLSSRLGIKAPALAREKLVQSLVALPLKFIKWDARPGNASVADDGTVRWFDWEHGGRRSGCEDFSFLMADEFWPLNAKASLDIYRKSNKGAEKKTVPLLIRFTVFQIVSRLLMIHRRQASSGWTDIDLAMRGDRIGATAALARRLSTFGSEWAALDPLTEPLEPWFATIGPLIAEFPSPPQ